MPRFALLAAIAACFLLACGAACESARESFDAEWRGLNASAGTGLIQESSGSYHIGLTLSPGMLHSMATSLDQIIDPFGEPLTAEDEATGRRTRFRATVQTSVAEIELLDGPGGHVALHLDLNVEVAIRARGRTGRHYVPGSITLPGSLMVGAAEGGEPTVEVHLEPLREAELTLGMGGLPTVVGETLSTYLQPELAEQLEALERVPLIQFPTREIAGLRVNYAVKGLVAFPERGVVFVGLLTNLRPSGGARVEPDIDIGATGLAVSMHPDLPAAAARLAQAERIIPRDLENGSDDEPLVSLALLERFRLQDDEFSLYAKTWDLRVGYCLQRPLTVSGSVRSDSGRVEMLAANAAGPLDSQQETARSWLRSSFTRAALEITEQLIDWRSIPLGNGTELGLSIVELGFEPWRIAVHLDVN